MFSIVPDDFFNAAIEELKGSGYYRAEPAIEIRVNKDVIEFVNTSKIVMFNGKAEVVPPKTIPAKGLKLLDEFYQIDGSEVRSPKDIDRGVTDRHVVQFKRSRTSVKQVSDTHFWLAPVTAFTVSFQHASSHSCGVEKLTGRRVGLAPEPSSGSETGRVTYKYPCASFSGQGFTWWVRWLS